MRTAEKKQKPKIFIHENGPRHTRTAMSKEFDALAAHISTNSKLQHQCHDRHTHRHKSRKHLVRQEDAVRFGWCATVPGNRMIEVPLAIHPNGWRRRWCVQPNQTRDSEESNTFFTISCDPQDGDGVKITDRLLLARIRAINHMRRIFNGQGRPNQIQPRTKAMHLPTKTVMIQSPENLRRNKCSLYLSLRNNIEERSEARKVLTSPPFNPRAQGYRDRTHISSNAVKFL